jgi:hypothetical protein
LATGPTLPAPVPISGADIAEAGDHGTDRRIKPQPEGGHDQHAGDKEHHEDGDKGDDIAYDRLGDGFFVNLDGKYPARMDQPLEFGPDVAEKNKDADVLDPPPVELVQPPKNISTSNKSWAKIGHNP